MTMLLFAVERQHPVSMLAGLDRIAEPNIGEHGGEVPDDREIRDAAPGPCSGARSPRRAPDARAPGRPPSAIGGSPCRAVSPRYSGARAARARLPRCAANAPR